MALNLNKTYRVLNYSSSSIAVSTRTDSIMIPARNSDGPGSWNFNVDELQQINNLSKVFKNGSLRFDEEYEEDIYEELRIFDWKDILTDQQVEDIILNPTAEGMEKILKITDRQYFNRIYGIFVGMRNAGYSISLKTEEILRERFREISSGKTTTNISFSSSGDTDKNDNATQTIKDLENQIAEMKKALAAVTEQRHNETSALALPVDKEGSVKPKTTRTTKKTNSKPKA